MKIILFGPPGVGKTTIGHIVQNKFGIPFFDADTDKTPEEKHLLATDQWTDENRKAVIDRIAHRLTEVDREREIVIATPLTKQWMRDRLITQVQERIHFILITSRLNQERIASLVNSRRQKEGHPINLDQLKRFTQEFEPPTMPYHVIENPQTDLDHPQLIAQISEVLKVIKQQERRWS